MSDDFGEISYLDSREGQGYMDMSRLKNFADDDFEDEFEDEDGEDGGAPSDDDGPSTAKVILLMFGLLLAIAAIGGGVWYFVFGGDAVVAKLLGRGVSEEPVVSENVTEDTSADANSSEAVDIPESTRTKKPLSEAKTITVKAFVSDLKSRGFSVEGLDVDIPYTSDGKVYDGSAGLYGTYDKVDDKDGSSAGKNAVTDPQATSEETTAAATADTKDQESAVDEALDEATSTNGTTDSAKTTDSANSTDKADGASGTSSADADKGNGDTSSKVTNANEFPILRARFKRSDGAEFDAEWIDGTLKLRVISDSEGRLTKAVSVIEGNYVTGFDPLNLMVWSEKFADSRELVCQTREITATTMDAVDFNVARGAIAGTDDIASLLTRRVGIEEEPKRTDEANGTDAAAPANATSADAASTEQVPENNTSAESA